MIKGQEPERWYETEGQQVRVYDSPVPSTATAESIVSVADLRFYRSRFRLRKVWGTK